MQSFSRRDWAGQGENVMTNPRDMNVVTEIKKRHGHVIDLEKSPMVIIEIIHNYRYLLDEGDPPDGSAGGPPGPPPSPPDPENFGTAAVLNLIHELRREVRALNAKIQ
jgi:hypothetical protein